MSLFYMYEIDCRNKYFQVGYSEEMQPYHSSFQ